MVSRRVIINLIAFLGLFVLLSFWAVTNVLKLDQIERPYKIVAEFESSPGLQPNVEATYLGVPVGSIDAVKLRQGHVEVTINIDRGIEIPEGVSAAVRRRSAVGEPYVAIDPPATGSGKFIDPEERYRIPLDQTSIPLSYGQLFASIDDLVSAVPPEDFATVMHETAVALDGRGPKIREILASADRLTGSLAARSETLDQLATDLTQLTGTLTDKHEGIGSAFDDLAALSDTLAASSGDIEALMREAPAFGEQVESLLTQTYADLSCTFDDIGSLMTAVGGSENITNLVEVLRTAAAARDALDAAMVVPGQDGADGYYLGGSFGIVQDEDTAQPYATPPTLPPPTPMVACAASGAPGVADVGDAGSAGSGEGAGPRPSDSLDVPARPQPGSPEFPESTRADADGDGFPLDKVLLAVGAALLVALLAGVRPWRFLPVGRRSDSDDD